MKPYYKGYIWGGRNLEKYGKKLPGGNVAESWEVSVRPEGESCVDGGCLSGKLTEAIKMYPEHILGKAVKTDTDHTFPLLFKLIDANDALSVQVHPGDAYAQCTEHEPFGKHEAWYILEAAPDASIVYGLTPGTSRELLKDVIENNRIGEVLNAVHVKSGDVIDIPPGTVHALGKGIVLAEIQQNSNLTYRLYDYGRKDSEGKSRELHIGKALDVIDYSPAEAFSYGSALHAEGSAETKLLRNSYFELDVIDADETVEYDAEGDRFYILFIERGSACVSYECGELWVKAGETLLIPACLGRYTITGKCRILKMYAPAD